MACSGFSADVYDRYVLGLVEGREREELERQLADNCPACLSGVSRALNLWLVFASTLEESEPSADFRSRMVRIAELSKKVLVFPKDDAKRDRSRWWWWLIGGCAVAASLLSGAYFAGVQSANIKTQQLDRQVYQLTQDMVSAQLQLNGAKQKQTAMDEVLKSRGWSAATLAREELLRRRVLELQAEAGQYRAALARQESSASENAKVLKVMFAPGLRMIVLKGAEAAEKSVGYALVADSSRLLVVATNLPKLPDDRQFQLWMIRKQGPKTPVSGGVFSADEENRAVFSVDNPSVVSDLLAVAITDEPDGGSSGPTTEKLMVGALVEKPAE